jgi:aspartyl-tRNA(Asn)/glutamyl-tRNA(Gln) amidotransferase subunit B
MARYGLSEYDASVLVEFKELGDFYIRTLEHTENYKAVANWLMGDITGYLNAEKKDLLDTALTPEALAQLVDLVEQKVISNAIAKKLLPDLLNDGGMPEKLVEDRGLKQITDPESIRPVVQEIIDANPDNVAAYKGGKNKLFGFFVGQVLKATKGKANPELVNQLLKEMLDQ